MLDSCPSPGPLEQVASDLRRACSAGRVTIRRAAAAPFLGVIAESCAAGVASVHAASAASLAGNDRDGEVERA